MSDFKAKMHQIYFLLQLCPRPRWGSLQRSHRSELYLRFLVLREGVEGEGMVKGREKGKEGGGRNLTHPKTGPLNTWGYFPVLYRFLCIDLMKQHL